ncbi:hypothetical protein COV49_02515 [Candidatus Falkowbacteria bacterium CG11_big_fil_rev_8_21_14_0_20_39_10]|uniref:Rod shape-determining protein MreD n=1 Tax=Candidatus Falkowbacteria bacterium CG11_big_fil_rev_8_21_14_0_20_39_10 TaxID=1974570 RepID=A0A2M6K8W9_9BACT|nr:MAG: hypothetical protein COV49_02515 [Candidatus Falkowbacteria bacterium CG11_big_fil_rev_8_21_14_0_20_39_10]
MYSKIFLNLFFLIILFVLRLSFVPALPSWLSRLDLLIIALVFILTLVDFKTAFWWSLGAGFLLDIFSFLPFGFYLVSLFLALLAVNFLFNSFFTNRSLYSFLTLTFFYTLFYRILLSGAVYIWQFFGDREFFKIFILEFWRDLGASIASNLIAVFMLFYLFGFFSKKLKPVFLIKRK